ncbi:VanZ family protein [Falsibacillus pallidus]|uniref:VanZ family protein n=1 Tax=Falsibacillus pallidus TaxID=493781 RepID=UPI003CCC4B82
MELGVLYFLLILGFLSFIQRLNLKKEVIALGVAILYGLTDELHQVPFVFAC